MTPATSSSSSSTSAIVPTTPDSYAGVKKEETDIFHIFNGSPGREIIVTIGQFDKDKKEFKPIVGLEPIIIPNNFNIKLPFVRENEKDMTSYKIEFRSPRGRPMWGYVFANGTFQRTDVEKPDLANAKPILSLALDQNEGRSVPAEFYRPISTSTSSSTSTAVPK